MIRTSHHYFGLALMMTPYYVFLRDAPDYGSRNAASGAACSLPKLY